MRNRSYRTALMALVASMALVVLSRAHANTIFSQLPANNATALVSDFGEPKQRADDFTISPGATVQAISWWGSYYANSAPASTNFALRFFGDSAGTPLTASFYDQPLLGATRTPTALVDEVGNTIYKFTANLPVSQVLAGSTTYYASVVENVPFSTFFWIADGAGPDWVRFNDGDPWVDVVTNANLAFELYDAKVVPLPAAVWAGLALLGGTGLTKLRRDRRAQAD